MRTDSISEPHGPYPTTRVPVARENMEPIMEAALLDCSRNQRSFQDFIRRHTLRLYSDSFIALLVWLLKYVQRLGSEHL
jgi:hypothetical protein